MFYVILLQMYQKLDFFLNASYFLTISIDVFKNYAILSASNSKLYGLKR